MSTLNKRLLQTTILVSAIAAAAPAFAQEADEITVTGTRIERPNLDAPSPITSVDAQDLELTNTVNNEQFLNSLPQAIPGLTGASNNPGNGTASIDLRGIGASRTLVLVDGHRFVSYNQSGIVDLNAIPSSLVERIDVVTGGASAVYGSDAMAGVVNFILKDDFEGLEVDMSYQTTEQSDGQIFDVSAILGGEFADGRGHGTLAVGYTNRKAVFQGDREFSAVANADNGPGTAFTPFGSSGVPGMRVFAGFDFSTIGYTPGATDCTAPDGSVAEGLDNTCAGGALFNAAGDPIPWINGGNNTTRYNYAPVNYLQLPQERYNIAAFTSYDLTDNIRFKMRGVYAASNVPQELAPTPIFTTVTINTQQNATLTADAITLLQATGNVAANGDYVAFIGRRMLEVGPRNAASENAAIQVAAGLEGELANGWDWDIYAHFNRGEGSESQTGNVSRSAYLDAIYDGVSAGGVACDFFGENQLSAACATELSRTGITLTTTEQTNLVATLRGSFDEFTTPWAESGLSWATGVEYREDSADFQPDSVLGPDVAGFNSSLPVGGRFDTYDIFVEGYMPLIEGAEFAEELSLNGAYRYSDYSTVGGVSSYAFGAEWAPNSQIRFRSQIQKAVRAPSINELFAAQVNGFPGASDPCAMQGTTMATATLAACQANGVPTADWNTTALQPNSQVEGLFGGNPNLKQEESDTFTLGFVAQPDMIDGLTVSVDYYDIEVNDYISTFGVQTVLDGCLLDGQANFCSLINRRANGTIDNIELTNQNIAFVHVEGIDIGVDYDYDLGEWGTLSTSYLGGFKMTDEFQEDATADVIDCAGYFGATFNQCGEPRPEYKHTMRFDWSKDDLVTSLRWRHIGGTEADNFIASNTSGLAVDSIDAYNYFDVSAQYHLNDMVQISGGIENLLDEEPPVLGDCCSEQANTWPSSYDTLGRSFFVGAKLTF